MGNDRHVIQGAHVMCKTIDVIEVSNTPKDTGLRQDEDVVAMIERGEGQHPILLLVNVKEYGDLMDEFASKGVVSRPWGEEIYPVSITRAEFVSKRLSKVKKEVRWVTGIHKEPKDLMTAPEYRDFMKWCEE
uniref:Uncharacterized protein n=1 Tax=Bacillus phage Adastra TaxID=3143958 RepID=A0AAU8BCG8_9CAUD